MGHRNPIDQEAKSQPKAKNKGDERVERQEQLLKPDFLLRLSLLPFFLLPSFPLRLFQLPVQPSLPQQQPPRLASPTPLGV